MNNDIGGIGVLLGLFLPPCILVLILVYGHFKSYTFGAKELCIAQMANLIYLAVNLAKSLKTLRYSELLVACSSIDAVSASISMAFSYKDVLAARKVVLLGFEAQLFSFGVLGAALARVQNYPVSECAAHIRHPVFEHNYPALMWLYYTVRLLLAIVPAPIAYRFSVRLNEMEHGLRLGPDVMEARTWVSLPATLFTNYIYFFGIFLLHGTAVVFFVPRDVSKKESWNALWTEWGQSAAFIVAVFAIIHVFFSLWKLYRDLRKEGQNAEATKDDGSDIQELRRPPPKLHAPDELLFNDKPLQTYEELQEHMTQSERQDLWNEFKLSFKAQNPIWINDCLDRGAPTDWKDQRGELPLHMAARLGDTSILDRIFHSTKQPYLLEENTADEIPLLVAVTVNAVPAIGYLLKEMMITRTALSTIDQTALENHVLKCFEKVIDENKQAALTQLTLWPNWPLYSFTNKLWHKGYVMIDNNVWETQGTKEELEHRDAMLQILIARSGMSDSERTNFISNKIKEARSQRLGKFMLEQIPGPVSSSFDAAPMKSRFVIREAMRLGLVQTLYAKGTDRLVMLVVAAHGGFDDVVKEILDSTSSIPEQVLDCAFLSNAIDDANKTAFLAKGARDWDAFLTACERLALPTLQSLLEAAENDTTRTRMLNALSRDGSSSIHLVIRHSLNSTKDPPVNECLDLLFSHGASAGNVDFDGNTSLMIALQGWSTRRLAIVKTLIAHMTPTQLNLSNKMGETIYDQLPCLQSSPECVDVVRALLDKNWEPDQEADLYTRDENGAVGMVLLEKVVAGMQEEVDKLTEYEALAQHVRVDVVQELVSRVRIDREGHEELGRSYALIDEEYGDSSSDGEERGEEGGNGGGSGVGMENGQGEKEAKGGSSEGRGSASQKKGGS